MHRKKVMRTVRKTQCRKEGYIIASEIFTMHREKVMRTASETFTMHEEESIENNKRNIYIAQRRLAVMRTARETLTTIERQYKRL